MKKALLFAVVLLTGLVLAALADDAAPDAGVQPPDPPATPQALAEISEDLRLARESALRGNVDVAEKFYEKMLTVYAPDSARRDGLFDMFECYRSRRVYSKAIAVGERIHSLFPNDPAMPDLLLKLGRLYRETGAYELATARFYNVLNAALRVDQAELARYRDYSTQAQFEIADTYVTSGDYKQAARMYTLVDRLDLTPDQKSHAEFQAVYCKFLLGDYQGALDNGRKFLEVFAASKDAPQCHYVLSVALKAMGKQQEASDEVLTLLRMEKKVAQTDADTWIYWQKKTGNQLANEMYKQGDYLRALTIYQAMARLNTDPDWQWPVIYQIGLCFERLGLPDRATEAYQFIQNESKKAAAASKPLSEELTQLAEMAQWRTDHVQWQQTTTAQIKDLLGPPVLPQETGTAPDATPITAKN